MNKIVFLKFLITFITLLIFLTLGGIVYGLVNYKTTPKLLSGKKKVAPAAVSAAPDSVPEIPLNLTAKEHIKTAVSCGDRLCLLIVSDFGEERVIVADPASLQINAVLK